ncbi:MAG: phage major capsid protein [Pirellulales bacterium]
MSKKLDLSELRKKKAELAEQIRTEAKAYEDRRAKNEEAWPGETRQKWDSINKLYDENERSIQDAEKDSEISSRVEQLRQDEERSRRTNNRPGLDDRLPGEEERTYGDAGLDREQAAQVAQRENDRRLVFRSFLIAPLAASAPQMFTDEMRAACQRMNYQGGGSEIMVELPQTRQLRVMRRALSRMNPEARQIIVESGELPQEIRALSSVTATAGPELVPKSFVNMLMIAILSYGDMLTAVDTITTQTGEEMLWPVGDDTANEGDWVAAEGDDTQGLGEPNPAFNRQSWFAYDLWSKWLKSPISLSEDSMFDIEMLIAQMLGERLGRALNRAATVGNGTNKAKGITLDAPLGRTTASASAISYDDLVALEHSVDPAYRPQSSYMFNDAILQYLRLLKDTTGRPLWQSSMAAGAPDRINNKPYVYNNHMASTVTTTTLTALYGRLSDYKIRMVRGIRLMRANERFVEKLQIGFAGYMRVDGKLQRPTADARCTVKKMVQA